MEEPAWSSAKVFLNLSFSPSSSFSSTPSGWLSLVPRLLAPKLQPSDSFFLYRSSSQSHVPDVKLSHFPLCSLVPLFRSLSFPFSFPHSLPASLCLSHVDSECVAPCEQERMPRSPASQHSLPPFVHLYVCLSVGRSFCKSVGWLVRSFVAFSWSLHGFLPLSHSLSRTFEFVRSFEEGTEERRNEGGREEARKEGRHGGEGRLVRWRE